MTSPDYLKLVTARDARRASVRISGEMDVASSPLLKSTVIPLIDRGCDRLQLDLTAVDFVDAAALRTISWVYSECESRGIDLEVLPSPALLRLLSVFNLNGSTAPSNAASLIAQLS